jgi:hypothetical protein
MNHLRTQLDYIGGLHVLDIDNRVVRKVTGSVPKTAPVISRGGIVNAANLLESAILPGELISILGSNFGSTGLQVSAPDNNSIPGT